MVPSNAQNLLTQLRRGVVEYCVLALIGEGEAYAFDIVRELAGRRLVTSEGTIYPLLSRLRDNGLVTTTWRESESGPPRRYYHLTTDGRRALDSFLADWSSFRDSVDALLGDAAERRQHGER